MWYFLFQMVSSISVISVRTLLDYHRFILPRLLFRVPVSYKICLQIPDFDQDSVPSNCFLSCPNYNMLDCVWNVMAHTQKPDFVFRRNWQVHLNRRGHQFSRLLAADVCASTVVMLDTTCSEVVWRVLATHFICQFPLHFPSHASPCAITFQLDSTPVRNYHIVFQQLNEAIGLYVETRTIQWKEGLEHIPTSFDLWWCLISHTFTTF
jgi:hypothetical protein